MAHWLRTDETQQAVFALEMAVEQLKKVQSNLHHWQWVIIGLHSALQGFMVLALQGTDAVRVLRDNYAKETIADCKPDEAILPEPSLASFMELYKKIKSPGQMGIYTISRPFKPRSTQGKSVKILNKLRNEFVHFTPKGWSLEVDGLPKITRDCLDIISFLAFDCGNLLWYEAELESHTKTLIRKAKQNLVIIEQHYKE